MTVIYVLVAYRSDDSLNLVASADKSVLDEKAAELNKLMEKYKCITCTSGTIIEADKILDKCYAICPQFAPYYGKHKVITIDLI